MNKKKLLMNTAVLLGLSGVLSSPAYAATIEQMETEKTQIQDQRKDIQNKLSSANEELSRLQAEQEKLVLQIDRLKLAAEENNKKARETENNIKETAAKVNKLEKEIKLLEEKLSERNEILKERARALQESGGNVEYIQVLLGSSSFSDFVDRTLAVSTIMGADRNILTETKEMQDNLKSKQSDVKEKLADLENMKVELDAMNAHLAEQKEQQDSLVAQLEEKKAKNASLTASLEQQEHSLANEQTTLDASITQQREAEAAALQKQKEQQEQTKLVQATQSASEEHTEVKTKTEDSASKNETKESSNKIVESAQTPPPKSTNVVTVGNRWIGNSAYVFGGGRTQADINRGFFDCSAFVHWAYSQVGIQLGARGSVSTESLKHVGTQVSASQMKPGDLVFFDTYKKDGHVGIYVGNGKFIGSQSSTGVAIANMSSGYWAEKFNGRVIRI
ncbi:peptidase [Priestia megaterium]|nr:peptidase [Priestia megaterium]